MARNAVSCGHDDDTGEAFLFASVVRFPDRHDRNRGMVPVLPVRWFPSDRCIGFAVVMAQVRRPVPFRTRKLRPGRGDGTALERVWESSTPPHSTYGPSGRAPSGFPEGLFLFPRTGVFLHSVEGNGRREARGRDDSSIGWRFLDAGRPVGGRIAPPTGCFVPPGGPWAGGSLHPLGVLFRREARGRKDSSSHWESRDAGGSQEFQGSFLPLSDGGIDWGTMHYFVPKRCVESNKIMYRDKATARQAADQSWRERGTELWVYRCEFCGTWHLTHRDPQSSYTYVPFNQQIKPHSRKKGYKPRRK